MTTPSITGKTSSCSGWPSIPRTFTNYAWTDVPFDPRESSFLGDYNGLAALNGRVYGIWPEEASTPARVENGRRGRNTVVRIGVAEFPLAAVIPRLLRHPSLRSG